MGCYTRFHLHRITLLAIASCVSLGSTGCSRTQYRIQADEDAYSVISERNADPRWRAADYDIDMDPRSRFFDPHDPDRSPMPLDDPTSQQYMREVNGMAGWEHWNDNGQRPDLENPIWKKTLGEYAELAESGELILDIDSSVQLAYVHSPTHQDQLETLYLSALDVTAERFRLDTQYFGGFGTAFSHNGSLNPAGLSYDSASGKYVVSGPSEGIESNRLTVGSSSANPTLQVERSLATAGQLLAGFANSFVFEFSGGDANLSSSLANFVFVQPLLRGAGRDIALEELTRDERALLGNLRAYGQFRQGFYTQVAIGESGVSGPQRGGQSTSVQVASGAGGVGGYIGLLQDLQQIRNSQDNLDEQLQLLSQTIALEKSGLIDLVQVDLLRQRVQETRATILDSRNFLTFSIDRFTTGTLGLPPDLPVKMDDTLIRQFELVSPEATTLRKEIRTRQGLVGSLDQDSGVEAIRKVLDELVKMVAQVRRQATRGKVELVERSEPARQKVDAVGAQPSRIGRVGGDGGRVQRLHLGVSGGIGGQQVAAYCGDLGAVGRAGLGRGDQVGGGGEPGDEGLGRAVGQGKRIDLTLVGPGTVDLRPCHHQRHAPVVGMIARDVLKREDAGGHALRAVRDLSARVAHRIRPRPVREQRRHGHAGQRGRAIAVGLGDQPGQRVPPILPGEVLPLGEIDVPPPVLPGLLLHRHLRRRPPGCGGSGRGRDGVGSVRLAGGAGEAKHFGLRFCYAEPAAPFRPKEGAEEEIARNCRTTSGATAAEPGHLPQRGPKPGRNPPVRPASQALPRLSRDR